jgi:cytochrome P450
LIAQIKDIRAGTNEAHKNATHPTIFHELLLNQSIPPEEKTDLRLGDEALVLVSAGLSTTAGALTVASFHISNNPRILQKLHAELKAAQSVSNAPLDRHKLEQLPYLNGCVHEGIRLSGGGVGVRLTRLAPDTALQYGDWTIPRNTPVSMTNIDVLMTESIFHNPNDFLPERWINDKELERFFVPFGKGSRSCLGIK